jgi:REP element-mobilizing transposase RayT
VEVTCRTLHSRLLLRPSPRLNQIILGILARAKHRYGVRVCFFVCASNHLHLLLGVDDARQLARFMGNGKMPGTRFDSTPPILSTTPAVQPTTSGNIG